MNGEHDPVTSTVPDTPGPAVGDPAGELADGLHFLRLGHLDLKGLFLGQINKVQRDVAAFSEAASVHLRFNDFAIFVK